MAGIIFHFSLFFSLKKQQLSLSLSHFRQQFMDLKDNRYVGHHYKWVLLMGISQIWLLLLQPLFFNLQASSFMYFLVRLRWYALSGSPLLMVSFNGFFQNLIALSCNLCSSRFLYFAFSDETLRWTIGALCDLLGLCVLFCLCVWLLGLNFCKSNDCWLEAIERFKVFYEPC